jgi:glycyl-tRNA synthetase
VTIRERDSMEQKRMPLDELRGYLAQELIGC